MEEIAKRIEQIIKEKALTNAAFADAIEIKRPIISHILSGRNKPSLHVVLQILNTYPEITASWLLLGKTQDLEVTEGSSERGAQPETISNKDSEKNLVSTDIPGPDNSSLPSTLLLIEGDQFRVVKQKS